MQPQEHWQNIYTTKSCTEVSWFQQQSGTSVNLIKMTALSNKASIIDVGGGASVLVDNLLDSGYTAITVLDISESALAVSQQRLGSQSSQIQWLVSDITSAQLPALAYDLWHDRAVFHFLTSVKDRDSYKKLLSDSLKPGGFLVISTFANDGPQKCSGLTVCRYSIDELASEFSNGFKLVHSERETHITPSGNEQRFVYGVFQKTL